MKSRNLNSLEPSGYLGPVMGLIYFSFLPYVVTLLNNNYILTSPSTLTCALQFGTYSVSNSIFWQKSDYFLLCRCQT